jgi:hypothetical protein
MIDKNNIDQKKRQVLKGIAAASVATAAPALATAALTQHNVSENYNGRTDAQIEITSRVSAMRNDLEVVLTNKSGKPISISQMTPGIIDTPRGRFDFTTVLNNGSVRLEAGENITVPIQHHKVVLDSSTVTQRHETLQSLLKGFNVVSDVHAPVKYVA